MNNDALHQPDLGCEYDPSARSFKFYFSQYDGAQSQSYRAEPVRWSWIERGPGEEMEPVFSLPESVVVGMLQRVLQEAHDAGLRVDLGEFAAAPAKEETMAEREERMERAELEAVKAHLADLRTVLKLRKP